MKARLRISEVGMVAKRAVAMALVLGGSAAEAGIQFINAQLVNAQLANAQLANAQLVNNPGPGQQAPVAAQESPADPAKPSLPRATPSANVDPRTFKLGAGDEVLIEVWNENVGGVRAVRPDGKITLPLINEVEAAGLTPDELTSELTKRLKAYYQNPQVTVSVTAVRSQRFFLTGKFLKTGEVPLTRPTTVLEAIAGAGGFQPFTNQSKIMILRGSQTLRFNYKEVIKGKKMEQNILLQNGDYIIAK
jgi:polysaccharide export outer membrane protein